MWIIVALVIVAGAHLPAPLAIGPDLLFARQEDCAKAAKLFVPEAKKRHVGIGCKFYPVFGGKKQEGV
jgi:hypothetical protein